VGTWTGQQHLAMVIPVMVITLWAVASLTWQLLRGPRSRRAVPGRRIAPWLLGAGLLGLVLWTPVLIQEFTGDPGNLSAVLEFAQHSDRATLGPKSGLRQTARALGVPPVFMQDELRGNDLWADIGPVAAAIGALAFASLVTIGVKLRRRSPDLAMLALTAAAIAVGGIWTGANVVVTLEKSRIAFYRWTWAVAVLTWLALGWAAARFLVAWRRRQAESPSGPLARVSVSRATLARLAVPLAMVLLVAVATNAAMGDGISHRRRDAAAFEMEREAIAALEREIDDDGTYILITHGTMAFLTLAPALAVELVDQGVELRVSDLNTPGYGEHRNYDADELDDVKGAIVVISDKKAIEPPPGKEVFFTNLSDTTREDIAAQIKEADVEVSPDADDMIERLPADSEIYVKTIIDTPDGYADLAKTDFGLQLLLDGLLVEPKLDRAELQRAIKAQAKRTTIWSHDRAGVWLLTPEELEAWGRKAGRL
jgi:hypothetical protein